MESVGTYLLDDRAVGGVVVTSRDLTERKEAEEALKRGSRDYKIVSNFGTLGRRIAKPNFGDSIFHALLG